MRTPLQQLIPALAGVAMLAASLACGPAPAGRGRAAVQDDQPAVIGPPAMAGVDGPFAVGVPDTPAPVWLGAPAMQRTTAEIMAAADRDPAPSIRETRGVRPRKIRPERRTLLENPDSQAVSQWPRRPSFREPAGGPLFSHTPSTPNVDVADLADSGSFPPDTQGDVGPTQFLLGINGRIRTIDKTSGITDSVLNASMNTFFDAVRNGITTSDPRVRFDRRTGRWFITMITVAVPNRFVLAVGDTSTSGGTITPSTVWSYYFWANTRTAGGNGMTSCLADYPTLGVDEDALYVGVNQFCGSNLSSLSFDSTSAYVVNKAALISGTLTVAQFDMLPSGSSTGIYTPQGVDNLDAGTNQGYFIGVDNISFGTLVLRRVSNPTGVPSLSTDVTVTVPSTAMPTDVPHVGGVLPLDGIDDRLMNAIIRNGRLWTNHQIEVDTSGIGSAGGGRTGVRWYELQNLGATPSLVQSGTVFDPAGSGPRHYWMGAVAPNGQGHAVLGMSTSGLTARVNAAVTGRVAADPLGTMSTPAVVTSSQFDYNNGANLAGTVYRWGDYSSTSVDPEDDMTMWTVQQYVSGTNVYGLRLLRLAAPPPASVISVAPNTIGQTATNVSLVVTGSSSGGSGFFDPGPGFARRLAASFSGTGLTVTGVGYLSPTSVALTVNAAGAPTGARTLTVTNPDGQTSQLVSAVTVVQVNQPPIGVPDSRATPFGTTLTVAAPGVLVNDSDPESQPLSAVLVSTVAHGSLTLNANGSFVYVPAPGYAGPDSFTYRASDGVLQSAITTATLTVSANQPPAITPPSNQSVFDPGNGVTIGPLGFTVSDPEGAPITVTRATSAPSVVPLAGIVLGGSGANRTVVVSTANATTGGASTIALTANDGFASSNTSFVVTVTRSTPPLAVNDNVITAFNTPIVRGAPGVLSNDSDVDGQPITAQLVTSVAHGTLALSATGAFIYTPSVGYVGPDAFTYRASDGVLSSAVATVSIIVSANNAPVVSAPASVSVVDSGTGVAIGPIGFTVSDPEGGPLSVAVSSSNQTVVANASLLLAGSGGSRTLSLSTVPGSEGGVAVISLEVSDAEAVTTRTFTVTVTPLRGRPRAASVAVSRNLVTFAWQAPPFSAEPVSGYLLEAGFAPGAADFVFPLGNVTAFAVSAPDGVYFVRLRSQTSGGLSAPSQELKVETGQAAPPFAPLRLLATVRGNAVQLQWSENPMGPAITGYQVRAGRSPGAADIGVVPLPPSARSFATGAPSDTYYVRVVALNASGAGEASNEATLGVAPGACTVPLTPRGVTAFPSASALTAAWSPAASGAIPTSYRISAGTAAGLSNLGVFVVPATSTSIGGSVPPGLYFIRVEALNACGASAPAPEISATVP